MRRRFALALCIFPFEEKFFGDAGVPVKFIGHPLVGNVQATQTREAFCRSSISIPVSRLSTILPGSRHAELTQHMPVIREACVRIHEQRPAQFVVAAAPQHMRTTCKQAGTPDSKYASSKAKPTTRWPLPMPHRLQRNSHSRSRAARCADGRGVSRDAAHSPARQAARAHVLSSVW